MLDGGKARTHREMKFRAIVRRGVYGRRGALYADTSSYTLGTICRLSNLFIALEVRIENIWLVICKAVGWGALDAFEAKLQGE